MREVDVLAAPTGRPRVRPWWEVLHPEEARRFRDLPALVRSSIGLVWAAGRREFLLTSALELVGALGVGVQLFVAKSVLDAILAAGSGDAGFASILPELATLAALTVTIDLLGIVRGEQGRVLGELVARTALDRVISVVTRIDLLAFESSEFYDRLRRAQAHGQMRSLQIAQGIVGLVGALLSATGIVIALAALQPLLLPVVLAGYVPLWIVGRRNSRDLYMFSFGMTPNDRLRAYLQRLLLERNAAGEVRAFGLAPVLRRRYDSLYDERISELRGLARRRTARSLAGSLIQSGLTALAIGGMAYLFVSGRMELAAAGAAVFGLYQLSSRLGTIHFSLTSLYEATLFLRDYASFLEVPPPSVFPRPAPRRFDVLAAEDVSFTYPDSDRPALDGVALEVRSGEVVALVGENGSGKTTLAKVLAGLYPAQQGRVTWDGVNVTEVDPAELRESVAVLFQDFLKYLLTARENVGMGRPERLEDAEAVIAAAKRADADPFLSGLPDGYETMLGREWLGGYDLSVGQWQRVALARAFFRDAPFVILDEPTAALDARAESQLFERMRELLQGRSVLLISHRFSSVRTADRIYVLSGGRIVEHGSHDELMAAGGLYAELFTLQARAYVGEA